MQSKSRTSNRRDLVLVGGGHAHVQVLQRFVMDPPPDVRLTLVVDQHEAVYSGMVPGVVAGDYEPDAVTIDLLPLARRAGARCIHAPATRIDPDARRIEVEGRPPIPYDVASIDVGSTIRAKALPGVREHAIPTRPIGQLIARIEQALERSAATGGKLRATLVGGGAAGTELAFCLEARLRASDRAHEITLITSAETPLDGASEAMQRRAMAALARRRINLLTETEVVSVGQATLEIVCGKDRSPDTLASGLTLWATGPAPHAFLADSPLPTADTGFVRVRSTFQVEGHDTLFAAGDCAVLIEHPWVPRAGVYAVRAGPLLDHNLRAALSGAALRTYTPQRDFLTLLNLGEREAIGGKWGVSFEGGWVWRMKDWIDRRFMQRFHVLDATGRPAPGFAPPMVLPGAETADEAAMECGGCAAKLGPAPLQDALARLPAPLPDSSVRLGIAQGDDAAGFQTRGGELVLASADAFRAFVDDPWLVGRVAAVNAVSDIQAKGGRPRHALAIVTVPDEGPARSGETLYQVLAGMRAALDPLGVSLVGGHSTLGPELFVGLSITGDLPQGEQWIGIDTLQAGDALVLTKPLGTGVLLAADMRGLAPSRWIEPTFASMQRDNGAAIEIARRVSPTACTDVSGFGLAGHLLEVLRASKLGAELDLDTLPILPGTLQLIGDAVRSSYHEQNAVARADVAEADNAALEARRELLFDPQTAGGLLIGVAPQHAGTLVLALREGGYADASLIGHAVADTGGAPRIGWRIPDVPA